MIAFLKSVKTNYFSFFFLKIFYILVFLNEGIFKKIKYNENSLNLNVSHYISLSMLYKFFVNKKFC